MRHTNVYAPLARSALSGAVVPGPSVSISPTTAPAALSRLISPAMPELLATVNVWLPDWAEVNSGAHSVLLTVTASAALPAAGGIAAIVTPAARAGTTMRTPATTHGRPPASRSQRPTPGAGDGAAGGGAAGGGAAGGLTARPAFTNAGMTTTR